MTCFFCQKKIKASQSTRYILINQQFNPCHFYCSFKLERELRKSALPLKASQQLDHPVDWNTSPIKKKR